MSVFVIAAFTEHFIARFAIEPMFNANRFTAIIAECNIIIFANLPANTTLVEIIIGFFAPVMNLNTIGTKIISTHGACCHRFGSRGGIKFDTAFFTFVNCHGLDLTIVEKGDL
jgi:hypothetical protein